MYKYSASVVTADVQSQNIVGFQQIKIPQGTWQLFTPTFKGVATTFKLGDITLCNASGVEFDDDNSGAGRCRGNAVKIYKMNTSSGLLTNECGYTSTGYKNRKTTAIETWGWGANRNIEIGEGEGLIVRNGFSADVVFQVAGEVVLAPVVAVPKGTWGVIGNNTPVDRVLGDFMLCNANGVEFDDDNSGAGRCRGNAVKVYKMDFSSGLLNSESGYTSTGYKNRETTAKETWGWGGNRNLEVLAGEALVIRNGFSADVQLKLRGPLSE